MTVRSPKRTATRKKTHTGHDRTPFACIALLLQGGGALGAYQAGVYQALAEADLEPDWVAGISIGAINSGIIAGNSPEKRVERLREFWEQVTGNPFTSWLSGTNADLISGDIVRGVFNQFSAMTSLVAGAPGFFSTRFPNPWMQPPGTLAAPAIATPAI
jgi:NTE family protein